MAGDTGGDLLESFLGALQASLAVLLTILYGVIAAQFKLIDAPAAKKISSVCVKMFLPALLITRVGSELHLETAWRYVPVLIWSLIYTIVSMGIGLVTTKLFKLPSWVTPAIAFNNTTSLPLLLIKSLQTTGILERLIPEDSQDSVSDVVNRAESYFLVCAIVGNCLTFALGPRLIDCEHKPEDPADDKGKDDDHDNQNGGIRTNGDVEHGQQSPESQQDEDEPTEETSLLPSSVVRSENALMSRIKPRLQSFWSSLSPTTRSILGFLGDFFNAPLIGALLGVLIGLTPALHRAFFSNTQEGGIFAAWLTSSLQNIGNLFASLQVVVVGINLSSSLVKSKSGKGAQGPVPWLPTLYVLFMRFIFWPVLSIGLVYLVATKTGWLDKDPILFFAMCIIPAGPSAIKVLVMADVNGAEEGEMMSISKFLTISYAISPLICFAVVAALRVSEKAMKELNL